MLSDDDFDKSGLITYVPPTIYAEISFCFDWDFPVETLSDVIGLQATKIKRQSETRINPITHDRNPGYWLYETKKFSSFDCAPLFDLLEALLSTHMASFTQILQRYMPCELFIRIWCLVQREDDFPVIRLSPQMLSTLSSLGATFDIVVENDYISEE